MVVVQPISAITQLRSFFLRVFIWSAKASLFLYIFFVVTDGNFVTKSELLTNILWF